MPEQTCFSLSDCIQIAIERNSSVKQAQFNADIAGLASKASSHSYIPSLSISNQDNTSTGRVLDSTTYQFLSNKTVFDMSAAVGASMTLFSGFDRSQSVKKSKINLQSALLETEKTINNLSLQVTAIFLNIVLDKEAVLICENKIQMLREQEEFISRKVRHKAATEGDLLNIQAEKLVCSRAAYELEQNKWPASDTVYASQDLVGGMMCPMFNGLVNPMIFSIPDDASTGK